MSKRRKHALEFKAKAALEGEETAAELAGRFGVQISMHRKGRFLDNIFTEKLWRTLKYECVNLHPCLKSAVAGQI
ncbi:hypothetical protein [Celeribacter sp.]|uniref:hypothetical protein n=1 Tax=Celeribacter sp. TaxID=1890673 RepID=UPI003A945CBA